MRPAAVKVLDGRQYPSDDTDWMSQPVAYASYSWDEINKLTSLAELLASMQSTREVVNPSTLAFPTTDIPALLRELKVEEQGVTAGRADVPPAGATTPGQHESAIAMEIRRRAQKTDDEYLGQLRHYDGRIRRATLHTDQRAAIEAAGQNTLADYRARLHDDGNRLHLAKREVEAREREFTAFQQAEGLSRLPRPADKHARRLKVLVIVLIALFECILNGLFFAGGSEQGLIGGVAQAIGLTAINLGIAIASALLVWPYTTHRLRALRALGILGTLLQVGASAIFNLFVAHFRDLYISTTGTGDWTRTLEAFNNPFHFRDTPSAILCVIGFGAALICGYEAFTLNDPYPGYSGVANLRRKAFAEYRLLVNDCLASLTQLRDQGVNELTGAIGLIREARYDIELATGGRQHLHSAYLAHYRELNEAYRHLVQVYRDANRDARTSAPPAYFDLPPTDLVTSAHQSLPPTPPPDDTERSAVIERITGYISELNELYTRHLGAYHSLDDLVTPGATPHDS